jgi:hypothetical protein
LAGLRRELRRFVLVRSPKDLASGIAAVQAEEAASESVSYEARTGDIDVRANEAAMAELAMRQPPPQMNFPNPPPALPAQPPTPTQNLPPRPNLHRHDK